MLNANELVKLWEIAAGKQLWQKALLMLAAAYPDELLDNLAALSIGNRNARLFRMRDRLIGTRLEANSCCPECSEQIEFHLDSGVICDPQKPLWKDKEFVVTLSSYSVVCRPANSFDLRDIIPILESEGEESADWELLIRCILQFKENGHLQPAETIPQELFSLIAEKIKEEDIHSEILCRLSCPECSFSWAEPFDIVSFFWREIEARAKIILSEVQILARSFGWWEGDILSLSDLRRKYYLEGLNE